VLIFNTCFPNTVEETTCFRVSLWQHCTAASHLFLWTPVSERRILICPRHLGLIPMFLILLSYLKQHPYGFLLEIGFHFCSKNRQIYLIYCLCDTFKRITSFFGIGLRFLDRIFWRCFARMQYCLFFSLFNDAFSTAPVIHHREWTCKEDAMVYFKVLSLGQNCQLLSWEYILWPPEWESELLVTQTAIYLRF
jgi:hypothetical protein